MKLALPPLALLAFALSIPNLAEAGKRPTGKGPCKDGARCREGVCVEVNGDAYCSKTCGDCPAGMYCDANLFAMVGMKVCLKGRSNAPVKPEAPPRLPCKTDDNCQGALICAQMMGHKDCTLPCATNRQCEMPEMMGVKMDFMSCQLDEGNRGRKACLPKRKCLANPASCMSMDPKATTDMMKGMMGMAQGMADGMNDAMGANEPAPEPMAAPAVEPAHSAMSGSRFNKLLAQVKGAAFEDDRATILQTAARRNWFSCDQLGRIVAAISFGDEKVGAVRIIAPRLVDRENSHEVLSKFTFDDDRKAAAQILDSH